MRAESLSWDETTGWRPTAANLSKPELIIYFSSRQALADGARFEELRAMFPGATLMGCSTGGQIDCERITDDTVNAVALAFDDTRIKTINEEIRHVADSRRCGESIGQALSAGDLVGIFVLSDGLHVNGSDLVAGIRSQVGNLPITGGLAGDGSAFSETLVGVNERPSSRTIAAVGFYGSAVKIGHGSAGGWDVFGPQRRITRSRGNVLLDLDGRPALELYARYLGEEDFKALPGSALLFPLRIHDSKQPEHNIVRTVLAVDRELKSMTFAGDMPEGWVAQLMRGNFQRLAAGAAEAARQAVDSLADDHTNDGVAILISCIGRRLLMGQRTTEEVEAVRDVLGPRMQQLGFYSYGEISPHAVSGVCELHNQTMTVTTITERPAA